MYGTVATYTGFGRIAIWIFGGAAAITAVLTLRYFLRCPKTDKAKLICGIIYVCWTVIPPAWFFFEYGYIFDWDDDHIDRWERMQDITQAFWASVLAAHAVIFVVKFGIHVG